MGLAILSLNRLSIDVTTEKESRFLVRAASLDVPALGITALVGASGSGKTTTGLAILRLLPLGLRIASGEVIFNGRDISALPEEEMRKIRGKDIGMVFQEPLYAFNPVFTIGQQIEEVLRYHTSLGKRARLQKVLDLLDMVGLPEAKRASRSYPHQLSGGMRQRAMIAQAIAADPKLIIADEPTSNLDVTLQAKIMSLFKKLQKELKLSILLITHDLGMVKHIADEVAVMHAGKVIEYGKTAEVLGNPRESYTKQLMEVF